MSQFDPSANAAALLGGMHVAGQRDQSLLDALGLLLRKQAQEQQAQQFGVTAGIDQGNLNARLAEQGFREREYADRRTDAATQDTADTSLINMAQGGQLGHVLADPKEMGPPPEVIAADRVNFARYLSQASPNMRAHMMKAAIEARGQTSLDNKRAEMLDWAEKTWSSKSRPGMYKALLSGIMGANKPEEFDQIQERAAQRDTIEQELLRTTGDPVYAGTLADLYMTSNGQDFEQARRELEHHYDKWRAQQQQQALAPQISQAIQAVHPNATPKAADAAAFLRQNGIPIGVGEANFTGVPEQPQEPPLPQASKDMGEVLTSRKNRAQRQYEDARARADAKYAGPFPATPEELSRALAKLDEEETKWEQFMLSRSSSRGGASTQTGGQADPEPTEQDMLQASNEAGPQAALEEIIRRAQDIARRRGTKP